MPLFQVLIAERNEYEKSDICSQSARVQDNNGLRPMAPEDDKVQ